MLQEFTVVTLAFVVELTYQEPNQPGIDFAALVNIDWNGETGQLLLNMSHLEEQGDTHVSSAKSNITVIFWCSAALVFAVFVGGLWLARLLQVRHHHVEHDALPNDSSSDDSSSQPALFFL